MNPQVLSEAQAALSEGNRLRAAGQPREAIAAYRRAIAAAPEAPAGHYNLGIALRDAMQYREAVLAFRAASRCAPGDFNAVQNVVTTVAAAVESGTRLFARAPRAAAPGTDPISIVVCSIRPAMLEAMQASFRAALGKREHEFVVIRDARSLSEGYTRGLAQARHGLVVFSHDDVELLGAQPFEALDHALASHDIVGVAGATLARGPAAMWAGHPHLRGFVALPDAGSEAALQATVFSLESGVIGGIQAIDGLFIAARRTAAESVGFDRATFDGFHFYDLDFSYRAFRAGLALAVTTEVTVLHKSNGTFGDDWRRYAQRFAAKFPELKGERGANHHYAARLSSRENTARFYDELRGLAAA